MNKHCCWRSQRYDTVKCEPKQCLTLPLRPLPAFDEAGRGHEWGTGCGIGSVVERLKACSWTPGIIPQLAFDIPARAVYNWFCSVWWDVCGSIAQLGEHLPYKQGVTGSSPVVPTKCGLVVQLVRTLACHARGREFESLPGRHLCGSDSVVECRLAKANVAGSNPVFRSISGAIAKW